MSTKNSEFNNNQNNNDGKLKKILSILYFRCKRIPDERLMRHKYRLCEHEKMQQSGVNYWETYATVVNWIIARSLLAIASINELIIRSINFLPAFHQSGLYVDVFMGLPLGMVVDGNRG